MPLHTPPSRPTNTPSSAPTPRPNPERHAEIRETQGRQFREQAPPPR
jgi:hypothetical protein